MSRTYRKFSSKSAYDYDPPEWGRKKSLEKQCLHEERKDDFQGDVVFPENGVYRKAFSNWDPRHRFYFSKNEIRKEYFADIGKILNGYCRQYTEEWQSVFIFAFDSIKNDAELAKYHEFEWLKNREIRRAIKVWEGNPFDVLSFLTQHGFIEKAVREEYERIMRK
jgi:hypothetical protein